MPEGPETRVVANILNKELVGLKILKIYVHEGCRYFRKELPGEQYFKSKKELENKTEYKVKSKVKKVYTYGKKIFFKISKKRTLFSFLGMTGLFLFEEGNHTRLSFELSDGRTLYYNDVRNFGAFKVLKTKEEMEDCLKSTGVDYFSPEMSLDVFKNKISNKRISKKTITEFFEDQKHCAGIGQYLSIEILYTSKISPYRTLESFSDNDLNSIYENIINIMNESYEKGGHSFVDFLNPYGEKGMFIAKLYGKKCQKDENGFDIKYEKINNRGFYWVPEVQI